MHATINDFDPLPFKFILIKEHHTAMFSAHVDPRSLSSPELLLGSSLAGAVTFPSVLALAQRAVFKPLRVTAGRGSISSICGGLSVCVAGFAASLAVVKSCSLLEISFLNSKQPKTRLLELSTPELLASTISSVFVFRALGGRFFSILPSHLLYPGAFARESIPAFRGIQGASSAERELIQTLGKKHGCHTCGRKRVTTFVSDHQPPSKIIIEQNSSQTRLANNAHANKEPANPLNSTHNGTPSSSGPNGTPPSSSTNNSLRQRFYPQCSSCSSTQGGILGYMGTPSSASAIRTHPLSSLRPYHLFMPLPLALLYLKSQNQENDIIIDISDQSNSRIISRPENVVVQDKETQTIDPGQQASKNTLETIISGTKISDLVHNFPLLIIWNTMVSFLDSFKNSGDAFHITLLAFTAIAALGCA